MGYSFTLLLLIRNGILFVVFEIFKPVTFNLWNQSVNRIRSKVKFVIHVLTNSAWTHNGWISIHFHSNWESGVPLNRVLIFKIRYWLGRHKLFVGTEIISIANQCSWCGLAGVHFRPGINKLTEFWGQVSSMLPTRDQVGVKTTIFQIEQCLIFPTFWGQGKVARPP